ncbi:hypothetical protein C1I95_22410 [Micromonospora craterilacus]|uniref:Uncharacterized protein n=1 Tax=Micromonospora craterilacus TaxID=1655439 RepID=A0A2W2DQ88_9ACTN|nr:hypothetical protein [Micromonospora craterilacus]PZG14116.1 hypothetical protein C1I95_22410 [Micromonospora craterilacus]
MPLYADTDLLRADAFAAFVDHMRGVIDSLESALAGNLPVANFIRDESDRTLVDGIAAQIEQVRMILLGLRDLSHGDANQVQVLGQLLDQVEVLNTDVANFGSTSRTA